MHKLDLKITQITLAVAICFFAYYGYYLYQDFSVCRETVLPYAVKGSSVVVSFQDKALYEKYKAGQLGIKFDPSEEGQAEFIESVNPRADYKTNVKQ